MNVSWTEDSLSDSLAGWLASTMPVILTGSILFGLLFYVADDTSSRHFSSLKRTLNTKRTREDRFPRVYEPCSRRPSQVLRPGRCNYGGSWCLNRSDLRTVLALSGRAWRVCEDRAQWSSTLGDSLHSCLSFLSVPDLDADVETTAG